MDKFLLQNVARYQELVSAFDPKSAPHTGSIAAGTTSPDMIVSARIRPLLKKDNASGFPGAIFPRPDEEGVVDIHDLYNHPRGRPILKVRYPFSSSMVDLKFVKY
jgi:kinesin family protein 2/24